MVVASRSCASLGRVESKSLGVCMCGRIWAHMGAYKLYALFLRRGRIPGRWDPGNQSRSSTFPIPIPHTSHGRTPHQPRVGCVHISPPCLGRGAVRELHARPGLAMADGPVIMMMLMMTMVPFHVAMLTPGNLNQSLSLLAFSVLAVTLG